MPSASVLGQNSDADCHKEVVVGKIKRQGHSQKAIERVQQLVENWSADQVWADYKMLRGGSA